MIQRRRAVSDRSEVRSRCARHRQQRALGRGALVCCGLPCRRHHCLLLIRLTLIVAVRAGQRICLIAPMPRPFLAHGAALIGKRLLRPRVHTTQKGRAAAGARALASQQHLRWTAEGDSKPRRMTVWGGPAAKQVVPAISLWDMPGFRSSLAYSDHVTWSEPMTTYP
jgi:hypothetical protein